MPKLKIIKKWINGEKCAFVPVPKQRFLLTFLLFSNKKENVAQAHRYI